MVSFVWFDSDTPTMYIRTTTDTSQFTLWQRLRAAFRVLLGGTPEPSTEVSTAPEDIASLMVYLDEYRGQSR